MFQRFNQRAGHYLLLIGVGALLFLPNLGGPSLWDIDEGNNATCAREMYVSDNWRVPTFNYQIRVDKPALLYWLQIFAYQAFGVGEFAARLPSALAGILTLLLTYELGRRLFHAAVGLLAGLILAGAILFCAAAHFANPDALLSACTVLTFLLFWQGYAAGRLRFAAVAAAIGLAVLAKGPVGLVLPFAVIALFLFWARQPKLLLDRRLPLALVVFTLIALPWYIWVGVETKFLFLRGFLGTHNVGRFLRPMENHGGPFFYYPLVLLLGFAPWSVFLLPVCWHNFRGWRREAARAWKHERARIGFAPGGQFFHAVFLRLVVLGLARARSWLQARSRSRTATHAHAFLWCWILLYIAFFSVARTKLPNYILPVYPAVAIVTAQFLVAWQRGLVETPAWMMRLALAVLALIGIGSALGMALAGGALPVSLAPGRCYPGVEMWSLLGLAPLLGALAAGWCLRRRLRMGVSVSVTIAGMLFLGPLAAWGGMALDPYKAPRSLAQAIRGQPQPEREIRIASFAYPQPSLVFYCAREVAPLSTENQVHEFLRSPLPVYLITPAPVWDVYKTRVAAARELGRFRDMYRHCDVLVLTNRP